MLASNRISEEGEGGTPVRFGILEGGEFEFENGRGICDLVLGMAFTGSAVGSGRLGRAPQSPAGARTADGLPGDALHPDVELFPGGSLAMPRQARHSAAAKPLIGAATVREDGRWTASSSPGHRLGVRVFVHVGRFS